MSVGNNDGHDEAEDKAKKAEHGGELDLTFGAISSSVHEDSDSVEDDGRSDERIGCGQARAESFCIFGGESAGVVRFGGLFF